MVLLETSKEKDWFMLMHVLFCISSFFGGLDLKRWISLAKTVIAKYPTTTFYRVAKRHLFLVPSKWRFSRCDRKKRWRSLWRCEVLPESSLGPQRQKPSWQIKERQSTTPQACHTERSKIQWLAKKWLMIDLEKILEKLKTENYSSIVARAIKTSSASWAYTTQY